MFKTTLHTVYFLGIGGIGMSALAQYFLARGIRVYGYDLTETELTRSLINQGCDIHYQPDISAIPVIPDLVIYTPAIPQDHPELVFLREQHANIMKRSEVLGEITRPYQTIAIAGSHGKTTVTTLTAFLFREAGRHMTAFLGGISKNYQSNLITHEGKGAPVMIVEADEFDRSFLKLEPYLAVVTSADADHLDIYGTADAVKETFGAFIRKIKPGGHLVIKKNLCIPVDPEQPIHVSTYSLESEADYYARNLRIINEKYVFDLATPHRIIQDIDLGLPGLFNVENAVAAIAIALIAGISIKQIRQSLKTFSGVKRRFDYHVRNQKHIYLDDYAHHPEELKACILAVKELHGDRKITGIFQPHLFSRTRDLADGFVQSLELLDDIILLDIYPARELPIEGITSQWLLSQIKKEEKICCSMEKVMDLIKVKNPDLLLTLGAGDIDQLVEPITRMLKGDDDEINNGC
ncbi:MAG: UDP-N-acetylmuramate--L-alanine ligase [Bacteroidetes bacterium]|nr:UDP-N-acetylmuramate--L-alanine ligase [Bacteroidota bacterium]